MGHGSWRIEFTDDDAYVSSGGQDCNFELQIVDPGENGKWDTFIDVPWGRPVTAAFIICCHYQDYVIPRKEVNKS